MQQSRSLNFVNCIKNSWVFSMFHFLIPKFSHVLLEWQMSLKQCFLDTWTLHQLEVTWKQYQSSLNHDSVIYSNNLYQWLHRLSRLTNVSNTNNGCVRSKNMKGVTINITMWSKTILAINCIFPSCSLTNRTSLRIPRLRREVIQDLYHGTGITIAIW